MNPLLSFYIGILIQAIFLIGYNFERKDVLKLLGCFGFGILALMPGKNEYVYDHFLHLLILAVFFIGAYAFLFKAKLLRNINKNILLFWNLIFIYIILRTPSLPQTMTLVAVGILSIPILINVFYSLDNKSYWRSYFYIWFLCIIVSIAFSNTALSNLSFFLNNGEGMPTDALKMFLLGASSTYLVANFLYLIELIPLPGKHQSLKSRLTEVRASLAFLASRYENSKKKIERSLLVILITATFMGTNYFFNYVNDSFLIYLLIAIMPVIDRWVFKDENPETVLTT